MTRFQDGPAKGQTLMLKRAPLFLRVVRDPAGQWDALDQLEDAPMHNEEIFCYTLASVPGMCHVRSTKGSGFYAMADYKLVEPQPARSNMDINMFWQAWCVGQEPPQWWVKARAKK